MTITTKAEAIEFVAGTILATRPSPSALHTEWPFRYADMQKTGARDTKQSTTSTRNEKRDLHFGHSKATEQLKTAFTLKIIEDK